MLGGDDEVHGRNCDGFIVHISKFVKKRVLKRDSRFSKEKKERSRGSERQKSCCLPSSRGCGVPDGVGGGVPRALSWAYLFRYSFLPPDAPQDFL